MLCMICFVFWGVNSQGPEKDIHNAVVIWCLKSRKTTAVAKKNIVNKYI